MTRPVIVTARKPRRKPPTATAEPVPATPRLVRRVPSAGEADMTAEEYQRRGDAADELSGSWCAGRLAASRDWRTRPGFRTALLCCPILSILY